MKISRISILSILITVISPAFCQEKKVFTPEELQRYETKAIDLTNFYFYLLNTLASKQTSPAEKEIIVTQSYEKYFVDNEVQVEDDLDENRVVPTNKNIAAYLKDVDFFFKNARFDFEIEEVSQHVNENGIPYFKVAVTRHLQGITVENDTLNNTQKRFLEINLSPEDQDLKIASIYTTKLSEQEDLINWWKELSYGWKNIFKDALATDDDSLSYDQIKKVTELTNLNLSENNLINTIEPLDKINALESLNISYTRIEDLSPLRNHTSLQYLNANNSKIDDISALRYAFNLQELYLENTKVDSIEVIKNLTQLVVLSVSNTGITNIEALNNHKSLQEFYGSETSIPSFDPLNKISSLQKIDISGTPIDTLPDLSALSYLKVLDISSTQIDNLDAIADLQNLEEIRFDNTPVNSLDPLTNLKKLKRIYSDYSNISRNQASQFMSGHPGVIVIFASDRLLEWWNNLNEDWQNALLKNKRIHNPSSPSKEDLAGLTRLDTLDISGRNILSLKPLEVFHQLLSLDISENKITDIAILEDFFELKHVNLSYNSIQDLNVLNKLNQLQVLNISGVKTDSLAFLYNHTFLKLVIAEDAGLQDEAVRYFHEKNPDVLVLYKSEDLQDWWENLSTSWQEVLSENIAISGNPDHKELHQIIFIKALVISNSNITDLKPLSMLLAPNEIVLEKLAVNDLQPLAGIKSVRSLRITGMPVENISPLGTLINLEQLSLAETSVEDIDPLANLRELRILDLGGTQIKNVKPLVCLKNLENLNIANTQVRSLKPIRALDQLVELICYNTRISSREVEKFKEAQPQCKVVYYR